MTSFVPVGDMLIFIECRVGQCLCRLHPTGADQRGYNPVHSSYIELSYVTKTTCETPDKQAFDVY